MSSETKGIAIALYLDIGGTMTRVAGRRGLSLEKTLSFFDASTADNRDQGPRRVPDMVDWNASFDSLLLFDEAAGSLDATQQRLDEAQDAGEEVTVEVRMPGGYTKEGTALVETLTFDSPHDDLATLSTDLTAATPLTTKTGT